MTSALPQATSDALAALLRSAGLHVSQVPVPAPSTLSQATGPPSAAELSALVTPTHTPSINDVAHPHGGPDLRSDRQARRRDAPSLYDYTHRGRRSRASQSATGGLVVSPASSQTPSKATKTLLKAGKKGRVAVIPTTELYNTLTQYVSSLHAVDNLYEVLEVGGWAINPALQIDMDAAAVAAAVHDEVNARIDELGPFWDDVTDLRWIGYTSTDDGGSHLHRDEPVNRVGGDRLKTMFDNKYIFCLCNIAGEQSDTSILETCASLLDDFLKETISKDKGKSKGGLAAIPSDAADELQAELDDDDDDDTDMESDTDADDDTESNLRTQDRVLQRLKARLNDAETSNMGVFDPEGITLEDYAAYRTLALARLYERKKALEAYRAARPAKKKDNKNAQAALLEARKIAAEEARKSVLDDRFLASALFKKVEKVAMDSAKAAAAAEAAKAIQEHETSRHKGSARSRPTKKMLHPALSPMKQNKSPRRRTTLTSMRAQEPPRTPTRQIARQLE